MKYSIITPVYNSYHLMEHYFKSLEDQTFKEFEIILIDDCSTDDSYNNIHKFSKNSSLKITALQTPQNMGPGYARNMGMDVASGEWITFVDNDDWVELDWLGKVNQVVCNNDVDCIIYDYYMKGDGERKLMHSMITGDEGIVSKSNCMVYITNHTIGKFYKLANCKEKSVRFPHISRCEDVAFTCLAIDASHSIYYLKQPLYYYFQRKTSLSNNTKLDEKDMINAFTVLKEKIEGKYPQEIAEKSVRDLLYGVVLMMCKAGKSRKEIISYIKEYESRYPKWYKATSISYLGRPKRVFLMLVKYRCIGGLRFLSWLHNKMIGA